MRDADTTQLCLLVVGRESTDSVLAMSNEVAVLSLQAIQSQEKLFLYGCGELLTTLQLETLFIPLV
jgi:hypothetical protein